jgi:hypothetical protein
VGNKRKGRSGGTVFCPYCGLRRPATGFKWHMAVEHDKFANSPGEDHRKRLQSESGGGGKSIVSQPTKSRPAGPESLPSNLIPKRSNAPLPTGGKAPLSGGIPKPTKAQTAKSTLDKNNRPSSKASASQCEPPLKAGEAGVVVEGIRVPASLLDVVHGRKRLRDGKWVLTTKRGVPIGKFQSEAELDNWWLSFQSSRGRLAEPCGEWVEPPPRQRRNQTTSSRKKRKNSSSYGSSVAYWRDRIGAPYVDGDKIRPGPGWVGQY